MDLPEGSGRVVLTGRHRRTSRSHGYAVVTLLVALLATGGIGAALRGHLPFTAPVPASGAPAAAGTGLSESTPTPTPIVTPTPVPTPTASATPKPKPSPTRSRSRVEIMEDEVLTLTNRERGSAGCATVRSNDRLRSAAGTHSADQAAHNTMTHVGSDGSRFWERAERSGYHQAMSENVAAGYRSAADVVRGWMNSSGHRRNILNCDARAVGIGLAYSGGGTPYWTQMFGRV